MSTSQTGECDMAAHNPLGDVGQHDLLRHGHPPSDMPEMALVDSTQRREQSGYRADRHLRVHLLRLDVLAGGREAGGQGELPSQPHRPVAS